MTKPIARVTMAVGCTRQSPGDAGTRLKEVIDEPDQVVIRRDLTAPTIPQPYRSRNGRAAWASFSSCS